MAEQMAAKLNTKLNYAPQQAEEFSDGMQDEETTAQPSDFIQKYEVELEINDFPQQARSGWHNQFLEATLLYKPSYPSVGWLVCRSVIIS